jgi:hypothetical protein
MRLFLKILEQYLEFDLADLLEIDVEQFFCLGFEFCLHRIPSADSAIAVRSVGAVTAFRDFISFREG